uniref:Uncharacterized protein n=1 Tax=Sphaerodactylus townsendi TaxID=933632 RepID=A0ACB8FIT2_9SAUR
MSAKRHHKPEQGIAEGRRPLVISSHLPVAHRYQVWLVGHSIFHWAGSFAKKSGWGKHLGLDSSVDIKLAGEARHDVAYSASPVENSVLQFGFPDAVLIQLGENDIPASEGVALQNSMREDLMLLHCKMPKTKLFWSCLLERRTWRSSCGSGPGLIKPGLNCVGLRPVGTEHGRGCYSHVDLSHALPALFCPMESTYRIGARTSGCMMSAMLYCSGFTARTELKSVRFDAVLCGTH